MSSAHGLDPSVSLPAASNNPPRRTAAYMPSQPCSAAGAAISAMMHAAQPAAALEESAATGADIGADAGEPRGTQPGTVTRGRLARYCA